MKISDDIIFYVIVVISLLIAITLGSASSYPYEVDDYNGSVNISNITIVIYSDKFTGISYNLTEADRESPYLVVHDDDGNIRTMRYQSAIAVLFYEVQELKKEVKKLKESENQQ